MKRIIALFLALTLVLSSALCWTALAESEVSISLAKEQMNIIVGKTDTIKATVSPKAARKAGVTYTSSDESVATVNAKGKVKGVAVGDCEISVASVTDPHVVATIGVHVYIAVSKMALSLEPAGVYVGTTSKLNVVYSPADATDQNATFTSSKESVARVSEDGTVTGIAKGSATITAVSKDGKAKARLTVSIGQRPESVSVAPESLSIVVGKRANLKATVLPKNASNKTVQWSSADERIATVDTKGRVTAVALGETTITATCADAPGISASVPVTTIELAKSVNFTSGTYQVLAGETVQLQAQVLPVTASNQTVSYKVENKKIASVDENGLLTGLKGGKTTVYVYTEDGSKKRGKATVEVIVPVTGVTYKREGLRVGAGGYGTFTATVIPEDATNKKMTWVIADESIASVSGTTNRFKIKGRRWGRTQVTGTTEDGGYSVTVSVNVGSLRHAVSVVSVAINEGRPYLKLRNKSNMDITEIRYVLRGYDGQFQPVQMSTSGNRERLNGVYDLTLSPGESTRHGYFTFYNRSNYENMVVVELAVTGWSTSTGYYNDNGVLEYDYDISEKNWEWVASEAGIDVAM